MKKVKVKPMSEWDRLSIDAYKARQAGMSYGQWKALQTPQKIETKIPEGWRVCKYCGKHFKPTTKRAQLYCEFFCRERAAWERESKKIRERKNMVDLTGQKFGILTAVEIAEKPEGGRPRTYWSCKCDCGNTVVFASDRLTQGRNKSCGCLNKRRASNGQA